MTTPIDLARSLASSAELDDRALGVAIVARGLSDETPGDPYRAGWPLDEATAKAAARYVGIADPSEALIQRALVMAPKVSDALLNKVTA